MSRGESKVEAAQTGCKGKMLKCASWKNGQAGRIGRADKSAVFCKDRRGLVAQRGLFVPRKVHLVSENGLCNAMPDGTGTHSFPVTSAETNGSPEVPTCLWLRPIRFRHSRTPPYYRSCRQAQFVAKRGKWPIRPSFLPNRRCSWRTGS